MSITVVEIDQLSKRFVVRKEKSLKERIVNWGRSNLHKDDFWALRDVNLSIESGSTVGVVGPNGSGKSTLLKMIGGILQPTTGTVLVRGRIAALLELGAGFHPDLTGRENVYLNAAILGLSRAETDRYFDEIVDFSGIGQFIDTQVKFYSSGMYVRLAFAVAIYVDPDILLVDEVLAVGDEPFQRKCMDKIRQFQSDGRTIIFVTHALDQVSELCNRAIVLRKGEVVADGPPVDSLRVLRSGFDEARALELSQGKSEISYAVDPESGLIDVISAQPKLLRVGLLDENYATVRDFANPIDAYVVVGIECPVPTADLIVECSIDSSLGVSVISTNTTRLNFAVPSEAGRQQVLFHFQDLRLGEGAYHVQATLRSDAEGELDRLRDTVSFNVHADETSAGYTASNIDVTAMPLL